MHTANLSLSVLRRGCASAFIIFLSTASLAQDAELWKFYIVEFGFPDARSSAHIIEGVANVTVTQGRVVAELHDIRSKSDRPPVIKGELLAGGQVIGVVEQPYMDGAPGAGIRVTGRYVIRPGWPAGVWPSPRALETCAVPEIILEETENIPKIIYYLFRQC